MFGVTPYGFMSRHQGLNGHRESANTLGREIYDILVRSPLTVTRMAEAITDQMENADSFAEANFTSALLSDVHSWTPGLLRRLEDSIERNSQVEQAFEAPGRIRRLVNQYSASA
jgi:hypothetical protein